CNCDRRNIRVRRQSRAILSLIDYASQTERKLGAEGCHTKDSRWVLRQLRMLKLRHSGRLRPYTISLLYSERAGGAFSIISTREIGRRTESFIYEKRPAVFVRSHHHQMSSRHS